MKLKNLMVLDFEKDSTIKLHLGGPLETDYVNIAKKTDVVPPIG